MESKEPKATPQDLRLGNYVSVSGLYHEVKGIYEDVIYIEIPEFGLEDLNVGEFEPIQLTEDVLLKCGFEWSKEDEALMLELDRGVQFAIEAGGILIYKGCYVPSWTDVSTDVDYLHQFQNLVKSLTGQELTINL